jgi:hypothetical protein
MKLLSLHAGLLPLGGKNELFVSGSHNPLVRTVTGQGPDKQGHSWTYDGILKGWHVNNEQKYAFLLCDHTTCSLLTGLVTARSTLLLQNLTVTQPTFSETEGSLLSLQEPAIGSRPDESRLPPHTLEASI